MTKSTSFASDVNFIKEFEELRLKQKLLIESLKKKESSKEENLLVDINTKLEFLVNLFKEAEEEQGHDEHSDENFKKVFERLDEIETNINDRLLQLEKSHEELKVSHEDLVEKHDELPQKVEEIAKDKIPPPPTNISLDKSPQKEVLDNIPATQRKDESSIPPPPDFSGDKENVKKEKKKWL